MLLVVTGQWRGALWEFQAQRAHAAVRCSPKSVNSHVCLDLLIEQHQVIRLAFEAIATLYSISSKKLEKQIKAQLKQGLCLGRSIALVQSLRNYPGCHPIELIQRIDQRECAKYQLVEIVAARLERIIFLKDCYLEGNWSLLKRVSHKKEMKVCQTEIDSQIVDLKNQILQLLPQFDATCELLDPFQNEQRFMYVSSVCLLRFYAPNYKKSHAILYHPKEAWFFNNHRSSFYQYKDASACFLALKKHMRAFHSWALDKGSALIIEY